MKLVKKILITALVVMIILGAVIYIYRNQIVRYSAETIIRKNLPSYIKIDKIDFRPQEKKLVLQGFKVVGPAGFSQDYILEIANIVCAYKIRGKSIADGIEILSPIFEKCVLSIERSSAGELNLVKMQQQPAPKDEGPASASGGNTAKKSPYANLAGSRNISDVIKIPESFLLKDSKIVFIDRLNMSNPYMLTLENINSTITMELDKAYSRMLAVSSTGEGNLNAKPGETVRWNIMLNPTTPKLTMSNRFEVSNLSILSFEPYYDKYSPLVFKQGSFSGTLIFDFDNGDIGSTNEIRLGNFRFYIKPGYENAEFWGATVPDIVKYFTSPYGEIVFDFKIKGRIGAPNFFLGPISKQAITAMAVDKISDVIQKMSAPQGSGASSGPKSDIEKAKEYIELFKGFINKK
jgi:hypothetical protein